MGRPEVELVRDGSPAREIAFWLRDLRNRSGLTYEQLARRTKYSISTLQEAASGRRLPTLNVTVAIVNACDGDEAEWRSYWAQLKRVADLQPPAGLSEAVLPPWAPVSSEAVSSNEAALKQSSKRATTTLSDMPLLRRKHRRWQLMVAVAILAGVAATAGLSLTGSSSRRPPAFASVVVQNKVAIGPTLLIEDKTPSYLASEAISHCTTRGCKLQGTEMWSGAKLVVSCWTRGEEMTNEDATSVGIERNPGAYSSDLWYYALWSDGRHGYVSEVYIAPGYRGGLGLKRCVG